MLHQIVCARNLPDAPGSLGSPPPLIPLVFVHGNGTTAQEIFDRVLPIASRVLTFDALVCAPQFDPPLHAMLLPDCDRRLIADLESLRGEVPQTAKLMLYGFSGGAQFAHRFVLRHPQRIAAVAAFAAGSWTHPDGGVRGMDVEDGMFDTEPYRSAKALKAAGNPCADADALPGVPWLIGCGTRDEPGRVRGAEQFQVSLVEAGCGVDHFEWDGGHSATDAVIENTLAFFNEHAAGME